MSPTRGPTPDHSSMLGNSLIHAEAHSTGVSMLGGWGGEMLPRQRTELLVTLAKLELDKVVLREMRTGMRVIGGR